MRLFGSGEAPQMLLLPVELDVRPPSVAGSTHAQNAMGAISGCSTDILRVMAMLNVTQVFDAVIGPLAVDVVQIKLRPAAMDVQPSQSMRRVVEAVYLDLDVSNGVDGAGCSSSCCAGASALSPREETRFRLIG